MKNKRNLRMALIAIAALIVFVLPDARRSAAS
jgi:hypothetical protein